MPSLLQFRPDVMDKLKEEFVNYRLLNSSDIPDMVWSKAFVFEEGIENKNSITEYMGILVKYEEL